MYFNNKVVVITGASSGIGAVCALRFAKANALLSLVGRNFNSLVKVANQCEEFSGFKPILIIADITIEDDIENIVNQTITRYEHIDVLINNAGVSSVTGVYADKEAYDRVMDTNVRGTCLLTNKFIPYLIKTKGNIVNISSMLSKKPLPIMTSYCMSKAAIDMYTKCISLELGPKGVRVNAVNPGPVKTAMFKRSGMSDDDTNKMMAALETSAPLKKIVEAENVAELVLFLASDRANCITGCCHVIDCGISLGDGN